MIFYLKNRWGLISIKYNEFYLEKYNKKEKKYKKNIVKSALTGI
jgi:hypothetical protein